MQYLSSMMLILLIAMALLMAGIVLSKDPEQNLQSALRESTAWGLSFFLCFTAEMLVIESSVNIF